MTLAVVRSIEFSHTLRSAQDEEDFEQELVDQYALAQLGAGVTDRFVGTERSVVFEFAGRNVPEPIVYPVLPVVAPGGSGSAA